MDPRSVSSPDTPAGHLLYQWLGAFNQASGPAIEAVLPNAASTAAATTQLEIRQQTGGFNLLSVVEVQPGLLAFRLRDQTPNGTEALGTLQVLPNSKPPAIGTFNLRSIGSADTTPQPAP